MGFFLLLKKILSPLTINHVCLAGFKFKLMLKFSIGRNALVKVENEKCNLWYNIQLALKNVWTKQLLDKNIQICFLISVVLFPRSICHRSIWKSCGNGLDFIKKTVMKTNSETKGRKAVKTPFIFFPSQIKYLWL